MSSPSNRSQVVTIFLSCADEDREFLLTLERQLIGLIREERIEVWHKYKVSAGTEWEEKAKEYLSIADIILLLVSPNFVASDYCYKKEALDAMSQYKRRNTRVIPIIISPIEWKNLVFGKLRCLPVEGKAVNMWKRKEEAFSDIVQGVRGSVEELASKFRPAPQSLTAPYWNVSHWRNPFFTGREDILLDLKQTFDANQLRIQAISGLPGLGKTQVATEYAYRNAHSYQAVLWTNAESRELLISSFVRLAEVLNLPAQDDANQLIVVQAVQQWLQKNSRWLLILDNVEDLNLIQEFVPPVHSGNVLVTTRSHATGNFARNVELRPMPIDDGVLLLLRRAGLLTPHADLHDVSAVDSALARSLVLVTVGLPLALDQAGAYIEETGRGLSDYVGLYQNYASSLLNLRGSSGRDHPDSVTTTFALSIDKVKAVNPAAVELLEFCAFLHPDAIPEEMIIDGAAALDTTLRAAVADPLALDRAIGDLLKFSLIQRESNRSILIVHRLIQAVVRSSINEERQRTYLEQVVRVIDTIFPEPEFSNWQLCQRYLPQAQACAKLIQQRTVLLPEAYAFLLRAGTYLSERGLYDEAEALLGQARTIGETLFGIDDVRVIPILNALATVYYKKGKYELVEPIALRALTLEELLPGPDDPSVGESLHTLAGAYHRQGRFGEEEPLLLRALALRERVLSSQHPDVATSMNSLANLYNGQGRYKQAEALYRQALAIWQQIPGPQHPSVALSLNNLAMLYSRRGMYEQAEPLAEQALQIYERTLGHDHPDVTIALDTLAVIYQSRGKYAEAEAFYKRLFTIFDQVLGPEHPQLVVCFNNEAQLYFLQNRFTEAEAAARRALTLGEKVSGSNHHRVGKSLNILADIYKAQGRYSEAEEFYQRALAIREQALRANDLNTASTLESYADLLQILGRQEEAESIRQRATTIRNEQPLA